MGAVARADGARAGAKKLPPWQRSLADGVGTLDELCSLLEIDPADFGEDAATREAAREFPVRVPRGFVARMKKGDPRDPLLLQVLPRAVEMQVFPGFERDPLAEEAAAVLPGLLHKYRGRVLLVTTGACAVHCRYCFRRHFPYVEQRPDWQRALDYIAADPSIHEVLLSGGDPLVLPDEKLAELARALAGIPHLRRLRVHTRVPIVLPERVDEGLLSWLTGTRLQPIVVLHANHPRELDSTVGEAVGRLREARVAVLNQAVLLRGVNDDDATLKSLSEELFAMGVLPYYLHLLDRVQGAGQFGVEGDTATALYQSLLGGLPGYLVPRMVREIPGVPSKSPLFYPGVLD